LRNEIRAQAATKNIAVIGITGTGGAGKSSLTDELIRRLRLDQGDALRVALISIDPSRRKSGGALLGDRIRMNAIGPWKKHWHAPTCSADAESACGSLPPEGARIVAKGGPATIPVFMRSLATRDFGSEISAALPDVIAACKVAGFDLIVVEPRASARAMQPSCRWWMCPFT
jgi:methylmalonyl-CoA mutase